MSTQGKWGTSIGSSFNCSARKRQEERGGGYPTFEAIAAHDAEFSGIAGGGPCQCQPHERRTAYRVERHHPRPKLRQSRPWGRRETT